MNKNRIRGVSVGRAAFVLRSPYPSRTRSVNPAIARGRRLKLPREICQDGRSQQRAGILDLTSVRLVRHSKPKGGATDRPSRKRGAKARTAIGSRRSTNV